MAEALQYNKHYVIGLSGGSASGKSSFLIKLQESLKDRICIISLDDFYKPIEKQRKDENGVVNFDLPESIDVKHLTEVLQRLLRGEDVTIEEYHFNNENVKTTHYKTLKSRPVLLVEGLFVFHFAELQPYYDLRVFIDAKEKTRFERRSKRDKEERGLQHNMIKYQWDNHVVPAYEQYLLPYREHCDLVINNNKSYQKALNILQQHLESELQWRTNLRSSVSVDSERE